MKIVAEDLARLCYNAIQWSAKDSSLGGVVMFNMLRGAKGDGTYNTLLEVYASDDYVAMQDRADVSSESSMVFHLGLKGLKELEKDLRGVEGEVQAKVVSEDDEINLNVYIGGIDHYYQVVSDPPNFSPVVTIVHSVPNPFGGNSFDLPFAIRAERFTKFRLLRTPESPSTSSGYPVDFHWDGDLIRWKCGPFLRGVVAPLTRVSFTDHLTGDEITGLRELYAEEMDVLWAG